MNNSDVAAMMTTVVAMILFVIYMFVIFAFCAIIFVSMWKIMVKAGKPGWYSLIPVYNFWVIFETCYNNNLMWFIFCFIPGLNLVAYGAMLVGLSIVFGKGTGFAILTLFLPVVGLPIIAFKGEYDPSRKI